MAARTVRSNARDLDLYLLWSKAEWKGREGKRRERYSVSLYDGRP
jgi:hypothetical protein